MSNSWEKQNTAEAKTKPESNSRFNSARAAIEYKTGKKLPENKEELFRNFDELVPKDIGKIDFAAKVKSEDKHATLHKFSREGVKSLLERELYGAALEDVEECFEKLMKNNEEILKRALSPDYESRIMKEHDDLQDAFNELGNGSYGKALMELEIKIADWGSDYPGTEQLRNFAKRLSVEVDKGKSADKVDKWKLQFHFEFKKAHTPAEDNELFENASKGLESGNYKPALRAIDLEINLIQGNLKQLLSRNPKERAIIKEWLGKTYGDRGKANSELAKLRNYREYLRDSSSQSQ
jgi:hypothetical protein